MKKVITTPSFDELSNLMAFVISALVEGCAKVGFLYTGEINSMLNVKLHNHRVSGD